MNGREAVFGFASWLPGRKEVVKIGGSEECAEVAELCGEWCDCNELPETGVNYPDNIRQPR